MSMALMCDGISDVMRDEEVRWLHVEREDEIDMQ